jgi:hypothetical protein
MKTIIIIIISFLVLLSIGCRPITNKNEKEPEILTVEIEENIKNFNIISLSSLNCKLSYIPLETTIENQFNVINYIEKFGDSLYITTNSYVDIYNNMGQFLRRVGRFGKGPNELEITAIARYYNNKIFIPNAVGRVAVHIYNKNGVFEKLIPVPVNSFDPIRPNWIPKNDSIFLLQAPNDNTQKPTRIIEIDINGNVLKHLGRRFIGNQDKKKQYIQPFGNCGYFYKVGNEICFKEELNDTIWRVNNSNLLPKIVLKTGKYGLPKNYEQLGREDFNKAWSMTIGIRGIFETEKYLMFRADFKKHYPFNFYKPKNAFYDKPMPYPILGFFDKIKKEFTFIKPTNITEQIEPTGILNDIDGGVNFFPMYAANSNVFISAIDAISLKKYVSSETFKNSKPKYPEKKRELEALANRLKDTDNPVLMVVTLEE